jgi:hypothetical protein
MPHDTELEGQLPVRREVRSLHIVKGLWRSLHRSLARLPPSPPTGTVHLLPRLASLFAVRRGRRTRYQLCGRLSFTHGWISIWLTSRSPQVATPLRSDAPGRAALRAYPCMVHGWSGAPAPRQCCRRPNLATEDRRVRLHWSSTHSDSWPCAWQSDPWRSLHPPLPLRCRLDAAADTSSHQDRESCPVAASITLPSACSEPANTCSPWPVT